MISFKQRVAYNWRTIFAERPDDPLPMETIAAASVLSAACLVGGALLGGKDFWINVLASLALVGPGLVITNVIARNWRTQRKTSDLLSRVGGPIGSLCGEIWLDLCDANEELKELAPSLKLDIPPFNHDLSSAEYYHIATKTGTETLERLTPAIEDETICQVLLQAKWQIFGRSAIITASYAIAALKGVIPTHMAEHHLERLKTNIKMIDEEFADAWTKIGQEPEDGHAAIEVEYFLVQLTTLSMALDIVMALVDEIADEISFPGG